MGEFLFKLPDIGEGMAEAEIVAWHVNIGDVAKLDELLVEVMTDKATVEITAPVTGRLTTRAKEAGERVPIGATLATFDIDKPEAEAKTEASRPVTETPKIVAEKPAAAEKAEPVQEKEVPKPPPRETAPRTEGLLASPAIRQRAKTLGIRLEDVAPTGPEGRVTHADLDGFLVQKGGSSPAFPAQSGAEGFDEIKVTGLRRRIAEKLAESARRIPHFAYIEEADVTALEELRAHLNDAVPKGSPRLTFLPFFVRATIRALAEFPQMNATFDDEAEIIRRHHAVHLGVATQTPSGLMVPVIRHCDGMDLWQISDEIRRLGTAAREGRAKREELSGSTITITSLGTLGGIATTPIINHPEVAIIGPNKIAERVVVRDGRIEPRKMMNVSSSFDHRIVDGYDAAAFIQRIKSFLEAPATIFIDGRR